MLSDEELLERLEHKQRWFAGKWSLDDKHRPEYYPTVELLEQAVNCIHRLKNALKHRG